jgi:alpha-L-rhamnosidase
VTAIHDLRVEHRTSALGIGSAVPRLSWNVDGPPDDPQVGYEVECRASGGTTVVSVDSPESVLVDWPFGPLASREIAAVRVRVVFASGVVSAWSDPLVIEVGLLSRDDWTTSWVSPSVSAPAEGVRPTYLLRAEFELPEGYRRARIHSTAHGVYLTRINGRSASDELLAPGWTSYLHRIRYQTSDPGDLLTVGANAIAVELSDGWYRGRIGFHGGIWDNYGPDLSLLLQLEVTDSEDVRRVIPLEWRWAEGPSRASLYDGDAYDARAVPTDWDRAGFDDSAWARPEVTPLERFPADLVAPTGPPVRVTDTLAPVAVEHRPNGRVRLDFGQNISGTLRIRIDAPAGHTVRLHHAEVLEDDELAIRPLRSAPSVDSYTGDGRGRTEWSPRFTIHGFRYAEIENWPGPFDAAMVDALVIHSDMRRTGWFESSHAGLNQLHENVVWSMRDNFVDLPTDCPQRDERLGWTGDIQVFGPTAAFLYASTGVLESWLQDLSAEQRARGSVPNFVPWIECGFPPNPAAAWGDAAVIVPWTIYQRTGDRGVLARQFASMKAWVDQIESLASPNGLWSEGFQLGDWLDPAAPPEDPGKSRTDKYLVSSAYQVHSTRLFARAAEVLGRDDEAEQYGRLAERAAASFAAEFVTATGRVVSDTVTAHALCLVFDLLPEPRMRSRAGARLVELVAAGDYRIQTGFVGTPLVCDALAAVGAMDDAYHLLLQDQLPSWLYPVTMGATTIWERWDSMLPDGRVNPGEMTSFNHYALGAVADFLHRAVAGLTPSAPGYKEIMFEPRPGGGLTSASARHDTPFGPAGIEWMRQGEVLQVAVTVPSGTNAVVRLPDGSETHVGPGRHDLSSVCRAASADPPRPVVWRPHSHEEAR